jgi:hypothetical protein
MIHSLQWAVLFGDVEGLDNWGFFIHADTGSFNYVIADCFLFDFAPDHLNLKGVYHDGQLIPGHGVEETAERDVSLPLSTGKVSDLPKGAALIKVDYSSPNDKDSLLNACEPSGGTERSPVMAMRAR